MEIRSSRYWKHPPPPSPFPHRQYSQTFAQWSLLGNGKASVIYRVTAILKQVNCAENITQLKILGSCPVTAISGIYCIFYSSLYSWRPFVEGRGGGGCGGRQVSGNATKLSCKISGCFRPILLAVPPVSLSGTLWRREENWKILFHPAPELVSELTALL